MNNDAKEPKVTIVIPTVNSEHFEQAFLSAAAQDYGNTHILVVFDGKNQNTLSGLQHLFDAPICAENLKCLILPENTGANNFNGHRIYGATSYLVNTDYICWLDEDNWLDRGHVSSLVNLVCGDGLQWAYSLRSIYTKAGDFLCDDLCESLGENPTVLSTHDYKDYLIDASCFLVTPHQAISASPLWYRRARQPGVLPADRSIAQFLMKQFPRFGGTGVHSVRYRLGSRSDSVQGDFFLAGNSKMCGNTWQKNRIVVK